MTILARLRADLVPALREGRTVEASMIRTLIAAIDNAGAIEASYSVEPKVGLGHDQPRRQLSDADVATILEKERAEVSAAIVEYRSLGLTEQSNRLELQLAVIDRYRTD